MTDFFNPSLIFEICTKNALPTILLRLSINNEKNPSKKVIAFESGF